LPTSSNKCNQRGQANYALPAGVFGLVWFGLGGKTRGTGQIWSERQKL